MNTFIDLTRGSPGDRDRALDEAARSRPLAKSASGQIVEGRASQRRLRAAIELMLLRKVAAGEYDPARARTAFRRLANALLDCATPPRDLTLDQVLDQLFADFEATLPI